MRKVSTSRFGEVEVADDQVFEFPEGILGFPGVREYFLQPNPSGGPFQWLQAIGAPHVAFVVCEPALFKQDYHITLRPEELEVIDLKDEKDAHVLVILVIPSDPRLMTANLQGPVVLNRAARKGKQVVLIGTEHTTKHRVFPDPEGAGAGPPPPTPPP
ncbi:MAG: flagellar assembly protein FliW, partial [Planctomycetes bacterium]|nr:flagellar assembly protein FliW [Planctomycetota bacterium]